MRSGWLYLIQMAGHSDPGAGEAEQGARRNQNDKVLKRKCN